MKAITLFSTIACMVAASASASDILWGSPTTILGTSDVSTLGTTVGTWGPGDDWGGLNRSDYYPVNGVTFAAYGSGSFASFVSTSGLDDRYGSYGNPGTADANYNYLLQTAIYSYGSSISLTWGGMTTGDTYLLQFWVQDGRNSTTAERSEFLTGGSNTSAPLAYGFGDSGPGQYIIGTFVADGTGMQVITLNAFGGNDIGPSAQINLLQLRDITPVPEPSSLALLGVGAIALLGSVRRRAKAV